MTKHIPQPPLRNFIELFWLLEDRPGSALRRKEAILPDGCASLVINLSQNEVYIFEDIEGDSLTKHGGSIFCGPQSAPYAVAPTATTVIGVHFRPGGALVFLPMPLEELRNARVSIESVYGSEALSLRDQLINATSPRERFLILENFLLRRLIRAIPLHRCVSQALRCFQSGQAIAILEMADRIGISSRRFSRVFSEQVGLTPKIFGRLQRFQKAISSVAATGQPDWARVAVDCGYYDQAHFIHEFRCFSSVTPSTFRSNASPQRNHLILPG